MKKYLQELIQSQSRIIIPDFGAFIISRDDGQYILFNNFLTFNDGLLVSHICEKEGINSDQALAKINDFITEVKSNLSDKKEYQIEKVGVFKQGDDGSISFVAEKGEEEEKEEQQEKEPAKEKPKKETKIKEETETATSSVKVDKNNLLILDEKEEEQKKESKKQIEKPVSKPATKPVAAKLSTKASNVQKEKVSTHTTTIHKEENNKTWLWILLVLLLLLLGFAVVYFFTDIPNKIFSKDKEQEIEVVIIEEVEEIEEEPEPIIEEVEVPEPIIVRQHHIIVGGFKEEVKAENLLQSFKEKGFEKSQILMHKDRYLVSANWFKNVSEAYRYQEKIVTDNKIENWILSVDMEE